VQYPFPRFSGRELALTNEGSKIFNLQALEEILPWLDSEVTKAERENVFLDAVTGIAIDEIRRRLQCFDIDIDFAEIPKWMKRWSEIRRISIGKTSKYAKQLFHKQKPLWEKFRLKENWAL
jgi:hypothetical protein